MCNKELKINFIDQNLDEKEENRFTTDFFILIGHRYISSK